MKHHYWLIGIVLAASGSFAGALGDTLVRLSFTRERKRARCDRRPIWMRPLWLFGLLCSTVINVAATLAALCFVSAAIVSPFAGLHIVWGVILGNKLLNERVVMRHFFGSATVVLGLVLVVVFGYKGNAGLDIDTMLSLYGRKELWAYLALSAAIIGVLLHITLSMMAFERKYDSVFGMGIAWMRGKTRQASIYTAYNPSPSPTNRLTSDLPENGKSRQSDSDEDSYRHPCYESIAVRSASAADLEFNRAMHTTHSKLISDTTPGDHPTHKGETASNHATRDGETPKEGKEFGLATERTHADEGTHSTVAKEGTHSGGGTEGKPYGMEGDDMVALPLTREPRSVGFYGGGYGEGGSLWDRQIFPANMPNTLITNDSSKVNMLTNSDRSLSPKGGIILKSNRKPPFDYPLYRLACSSISGICGGNTNVLAEGVLNALLHRGLSVLGVGHFFAVAGVLVASAIGQILFLNVGLSKFEASYVIPISMGSLIASSSLANLCLYADIFFNEAPNVSLFFMGAAMVIGGIRLLSSADTMVKQAEHRDHLSVIGKSITEICDYEKAGGQYVAANPGHEYPHGYSNGIGLPGDKRGMFQAVGGYEGNIVGLPKRTAKKPIGTYFGCGEIPDKNASFSHNGITGESHAIKTGVAC